MPCSPTRRSRAAAITAVSSAPAWQRRDGVESGREPGELDPGGVPGERVGQRGPAGGVDGPHPAQVAVVPAGGEQGRQGELVERAGAAVAHLLLGGDRCGQRRRGVDPAEADRGRQRLAGRAEQEDLVWG